MRRERLNLLEEPETGNQRSWRAFSDLMLGKLTLTGATHGTFSAYRVAEGASTTSGGRTVYQSAAPAGI